MANAWESAPVVSGGAGKAAWEAAPVVEEKTKPAARPVAKTQKPLPSLFSDPTEQYTTEATEAQAVPGVGFIRGFADIGNTLLNAGVKAASAVAPKDVADRIEAWNKERQGGLASLDASMAARPDTAATYGAGRTSGNILATAPVGGALGQSAKAVGLPRLANALASGGMTTGGAPVTLGQRAVDLGIRSIGGGITGGVSAGLIDPKQAETGAIVGAALPVAIKGVGSVSNAIGRTIAGPPVPPAVTAQAQAARDAGYVIPPTQAKPTLVNRLLEGSAGKASVAQNASMQNQGVTNALVKTELGLPQDAQITTEALDGIRKEAGKAYADISKLGSFDATGAKLPNGVKVTESIDPLIGGKVKSVDAGDLVQEWKQANHDATGYYRAYARDANPDTLAKAKAAASSAKKIDEFLDQQLQQAGQGDLLSRLKEARVAIAKTYSVENALDRTTGNIDAKKFAQMLQKDKPLSGALKTVGDFAGQFKTAVQTPEKMGSLPQFSPLDLYATGLAGASSMYSNDPKWMALAAVRPAARSIALSPLVQNRLATQATRAVPGVNMLADPDLQQLLYRSAPVLAEDR